MGHSYRKGLQLSLGLIQAQVDLHTVLPSKSSTGLKRLCPDHHALVKQQNVCSAEDHAIPWGGWVMGQETPSGWKIVQATDKPEESAAETLDLSPVPAKELTDNTFDGDAIYFCKPTNDASNEAWQVFINIAKKDKVALVAKGALRRGQPKLWRLGVFRDYLVLREIAFPEAIKDTPEAPDVKVPKQTTLLVDQFVNQLMTEWDKLDTEDTGTKRIKEWLDSGDLIEDVIIGKDTNDEPQKAIVNLQQQLAEAIKKAS